MQTEHSSFTVERSPLFAAIPALAAQKHPRSRPPSASASIALHNAFRHGVVPDSSEHDVLVLILSLATVKKDARALAQRLLDSFGDLNRVICAAPIRLRKIDGMSDAAITALKLIEHCAQRMARARIADRPVISCWRDLLDYCHTQLAHRTKEQFRVLFLDRKNVLIADEVMGEGTVDHVPVYPREVLRRALEHDACSLILVHNHPSGDPTPSEADIAMTQAIRSAADFLSITLHDHLIIGHSREVSFRSEGLI